MTPLGLKCDRVTALSVALAIAFVGLVRLIPLFSVYRAGDVVLLGNDPYAYRYYVEQAVTGTGARELAASGEPLFIATVALISEIGGGVEAAAHVLAWYPVLASLFGGVVVYLLAVAVTEDRRVGIAAVVFFALIPGHALRTSVGFADHHAFDYIWLGATALMVTWLDDGSERDTTALQTYALVVGIGVGVAGQVLSWEGGPLLIVPIGVVVAWRAAVDVHHDTSPAPAGVPLVGALAIGAVTVAVCRWMTGMQSTAVALAPAVLAASAALALALSLLAYRRSWGVPRLLCLYAITAVPSLVGLSLSLGPVWSVATKQLRRLMDAGAVAETQGLFDPDTFGALFLVGFALVLAIGPMLVGLRRALNDSRWIALSVYAWCFFILASLQSRFVGELATFLAVFAGIGLVWIAMSINAIPRTHCAADALAPIHLPGWRTVGLLLALTILFGSFGAYQTSVLTNEAAVDDVEYETAEVIASHSDARGLSYPENYVLSAWDTNRMYNYVVSGRSGSYTYARRNYGPFVSGENNDSWKRRSFDGRVGYIVLASSARPNTSTSENYETVHVSDDGSRIVVSLAPNC